MSAETSIQWTDRTWNPVRGCALVSEGCRHCYAMKVAHRFSGPGKPYEGLTEIGPAGPRWTGRARVVPDALGEPLRWRKSQRIFVNSMSDLFHEDVPFEFIDNVFATMVRTPRHVYQVLTKRPERMREYFASGPRSGRVGDWLVALNWPLQNAWLGVSCENQQTADERIPLLLQTPAAVRFLSLEPLLGPIDIATAMYPPDGAIGMNTFGFTDGFGYEALLQWVIVGGESGPGARPCDVDWIRGIVHDCRAADVPCFVKQLGAKPRAHSVDDVADIVWRELDAVDPALCELPFTGGLRDRKGGDPSEWPEDLRIRLWPEAVQAGSR